MVFRADLADLAAPVFDSDGSARAQARLTRVGIFEYHNPDGSIRRELRLPEDVFHPDAMVSFRSKPVTDEHPPEMVDANNWQDHTIGWVSGKPKRDGDHVRGWLYFPDAEKARRMWRQGRRQVSLGYSCSLEEKPGVHPTYGRYDAIQRNIVGNHCAIVDCARAGHTAAFRFDAEPRRRYDVDGNLLASSTADQVDEQLREDYPPGARKWVHEVKWSGPERVPLEKVDYSNASSWRASHEPEHVGNFVEKIGKGWEKPIILCRRPGHDDLMVVDGHHRSLAYQKLGKAPLAYVAEADQPEGPWDEMHDQQRAKQDTMKKQDGSPDEPRDEHGRWSGGGDGAGGGGKSFEELHAAGHAAAAQILAKTKREPSPTLIKKAHAAAFQAIGREDPQAGTATHKVAPFSHGIAAVASKAVETALAAHPSRKADAAARASADLLAPSKNRAILRSDMADPDKSLPTAPQGGHPVSGDPDPKSEAARNAKGENDADPKDKPAPAPGPEEPRETADDLSDVPDMPADITDSDDDDDDDDDGDDDDSDDDTDNEDAADCPPGAGHDAYDESYNDDGTLNAKARHKLAASSFAVPDREGLPIHDPGHTKAAMARFNQYQFKGADEKHAAFNRIVKRAGHFGIDASGFKANQEDHLDSKDDMNKLAQLQQKLDAMTAERDTLQGRLDAASARQPREDADEIAKRVDAKVALVAEARAIGAKVDSKMSTRDIHLAVVKHVDGADLPADKSDVYVQARYDACVEGHRKDAAKTDAGQAALDQARTVAAAPAAPREDAERVDLATAEAAARARNAQAYRHVPTQYTREFIMAKGGSPTALTQLALKNITER